MMKKSHLVRQAEVSLRRKKYLSAIGFIRLYYTFGFDQSCLLSKMHLSVFLTLSSYDVEGIVSKFGDLIAVQSLDHIHILF